jgi:hypothetical protein
MRGDMTQQALDLIYRLFYDSGGIWPTLRDLQRALKRQGHGNVDAFEIVQHIAAKFLEPLPNANTHPAPTEKLILTIEGIERCAGSGEDIENFLITLKLLVRWTDRPDLAGDPGEGGIRFTAHQLAEAVSLLTDADERAIHRLIAILRAEGLVQDDGDED